MLQHVWKLAGEIGGLTAQTGATSDPRIGEAARRFRASLFPAALALAFLAGCGSGGGSAADSVAAGDSLEARLTEARDTVVAILARATANADTAAQLSVSPTTFTYNYSGGTGAGWEVTVVVTDTSSCPVEKVKEDLAARGWVRHPDYDADGADGTRYAMDLGPVMCVIEGTWEGGDPSDSTYVPAPGCRVVATLVPTRADDIMK